MGTQPEEVERALRGRRTLPEPGEPRTLEGEPPAKTTSPSPERQPEADLGEGLEGPKGQMFTPEEEKRFQIRGGRLNAASKEGKDRV